MREVESDVDFCVIFFYIVYVDTYVKSNRLMS